jgi:hypothetical protein
MMKFKSSDGNSFCWYSPKGALSSLAGILVLDVGHWNDGGDCDEDVSSARSSMMTSVNMRFRCHSRGTWEAKA